MLVGILSRRCTQYPSRRLSFQIYASLHTSTNKPIFQLPPPPQRQERVLQSLPLPVLVRTLAVLSVAALPSPILLWFIRTIRRHSELISSSPVLQWPIRKLFYDTFCIGQTKSEITANISALRSRGINGVVLAFPREAKLGEAVPATRLVEDDPCLKSWVSSNLDTIDQVGPGDYIAVKFTGAGPAAVKALEDFSKAQPGDRTRAAEGLSVLQDATFEICRAAEKKGVKVMVDAESSVHQPGIDHLTLESMAKFNAAHQAVVYNTYQMYLTSAMDTLKAHLKDSSKRGYVAGIKLVRGAYLYTEPERQSIIHASKDATDNCYDTAVEYLLEGKEATGNADTKPWVAEVMLATHNSGSVDKAFALFQEKRRELAWGDSPKMGGKVQRIVFAQLMGMADEISMKLARDIKQAEMPGGADLGLGVYKYTVWGSFQDCLLYMLRRAEENQDAVARSRVTALAMLKEIGSRLLFWR